MRTLLRSMLLVVGLASGATVFAGDVSVAVAANFSAPMQRIAQLFEQDTGHKALLAFGSTGKFYAQIKNGAPFQILLAADAATPERLEKEGLGVANSRFTYATGKLVLWSKQADLVDNKGDVLRGGKFARLAIANPKTAPYGAAAIETLTALGLLESVQAKFVQGENIAQAHQFTATENAALGFVALSQVFADGRIIGGSAWIVPATLHKPLQQDAVLLTTGKDNPAAIALMAYLRGDKAKTVMRSFGYGV